ncbi:hypothetical protein [Kordiimonas laminariae]|uniref:hypothetical protein n=1 Tax=Kordiimonas laminariae TaxID=2917717 RepID=UPI001FF5109C|nr:hypothetical protein [Kordiimonas laminariae]MCK0070719.1 hypothetical protein [Kordiimonas laminariae]
MSAKTKLRNAMSAIDDAKRALKRVQGIDEAYHDARRAIRYLEDAESDINRAIREVKRL